MKIKYILLSTLILSASYDYSSAQSIDDAVSFSKDDNAGSARIKGMGNVQTALGGDISAVNGNPAGLGFFSRSDISITFDYLQNSNKATFFGQNSKSNKGNFGIAQAGVVFNFPNQNQATGRRGWQNFNMGITYNKKQNFTNSLIYDGVNNESSIVNNFAELMNMDAGFEEDFYKSYLVENFQNSLNQYFPLVATLKDKDQYNDILTKGSNNNTAIAIGGNYNNKFYIGATLGLSFFKYEKSKVFEENGLTKLFNEVAVDNPDSELADPQSEDYQDFGNKSYRLIDEFTQNTEGSGIDLKIGMIYKPTTDWNVGLTITTPTWLTINEYTEAFTDVDFYPNRNSNDSYFTYNSDLYSSEQDYNLTTPWKFALGATKFFGCGLLSAEAEYVTYNTARYSNPQRNNAFTYTNDDIKDNLQGVMNFRVGGEYLVNNVVSARAGFNYFGNPYSFADETNVSGSLGVGFKLNNSTYLDIAVTHQVNSFSVTPYAIDENLWKVSSPIADLKYSKTNALITLGAKF